jgi:DNA-binding transcriptional MerR regulator
MLELVKIGAVARETGLSIDTIRFYQKSGLIPGLARSGGGYRIFGPEQLTELHFIGKAQQLGFSLREIKELLLLRGDAAHSCLPVRERLEQKLGEVRHKIDALQKLEHDLKLALRKCKRMLRDGPKSTHRSECPLLAELEEANGGR